MNLVLKYFHNTMGKAITRALIKREFFWPGMISNIYKNVKVVKLLSNLRIVKLDCKWWSSHLNRVYGHLWTLTSIDGNNCILILIDGFSKFCVLLPLRDMEAHNIVKVLFDSVWKTFGSPEQIVSDNASYFNSRVIKDMCFVLGCDTHKH
ncbi:hypothetical protein PR048_012125 [Dryococelus australis]|uniref:Integrase catalytic domain-containing protein n=1 Tax=Dryococelus australis TaxID=614101 RepID=A0ABQ9HNJ1_9NEOP|nr:hypothetical protein PR048_012125 [Dryococelus australis]